MTVATVSWIPSLIKLEAKPPLHAVIIGINKFKYQNQLSAAVNDARAFETYLIDKLSVPKGNIRVILDEEATRSNIIGTIRSLKDNENIKRNEAIVIYFAGHGAEVPPPPDRAINGPLVQCIIPYDASTKEDSSANAHFSIDGDKRVSAIPDFTIGALMDELAQYKGDNITLILDCCHSAGGSRDGEDGARFVPPEKLALLPENLDSEILDSTPQTAREKGAVPGFPGQAMQSHVLLAGCGQKEKSYEHSTADPPYGNFTAALLNLLRSLKIDNLTYKGCMERFPQLCGAGPQHPVCEGKNINRMFFNAQVAGADESFITIKYEPPNYYLQAGSAHGITPGSVFAVYNEPILKTENKPLCELVVGEMGPFSVILRRKDKAILGVDSLPVLTYGRQVGYGQEQALDVYIEPRLLEAAKPDNVWTRAFSGSEDHIALRPAEKGVAQLIVELDENKKDVVFTLTDQLAVKYGVQRLYEPIPFLAGNTVAVMRAAARWNWHLRRTSGEHKLQPRLNVKFFKLKQIGADSVGKWVWGPTGDNLIKDGVAEIDLGGRKDQQPYGIEVTNNSGRDLYVYPFYFSLYDQAIQSHYVRVYGGKTVDPTLPRDEASSGTQKANYATIGYGASGVDTLGHYMPEDRDIDVGIYKIFVTTEATQFDSIEQISPFATLSRDSREPTDKPTFDPLRNQALWDTVSFTVVQRRLSPPINELASRTKSFLPLKIETDPGTFLVRSYSSRASGLASDFMLGTSALSNEFLSDVAGMKLHTCSKQTVGEQRSDNGAWFRIILLGPDGNIKAYPGDDQRELSWISHSNEQVGSHGIECTWATGPDFARGHELWQYAKAGDAIQARIEAKGRSWSNKAVRAVLEFW